MNQLFTLAAQGMGLALLLSACRPEKKCYDLDGRWSNREGQIFLFQPGGKALMLLKFGSQFDTFPVGYRYDCSGKNPTLDLLGFQSGPLNGKSLYGIVEWSSDSVFRFDAESGASPEVRPAEFSSEQTEKYFRER